MQQIRGSAMSASQEQTFETWMKPSMDVFQYWISFFPTAPLFGVDYRFAPSGSKPAKPAAKAAAPAKPAPAPKAKAPATPAKPAATKVDAAPSTDKVVPLKPVAEPKISPKVAVKPEAEAKPAPKIVAKPVADTKPAPKVAAKPVAEIKPTPKVAPKAEAEPKTAPAAAETKAAEPKGDVSELVKPKGLLIKAPADADNLKLIKGIGPGLESQLNGLGIYRFKQMAKFTKADLEWIDASLTAFKGRCFRDDWAGQAKGLIG